MRLCQIVDEVSWESRVLSCRSSYFTCHGEVRAESAERAEKTSEEAAAENRPGDAGPGRSPAAFSAVSAYLRPPREIVFSAHYEAIHAKSPSQSSRLI